ncbi:MAG: DUF2339 domain-containing protein [Cytophagales bacterium]|nr:MAG: DUF2339 domain-containing protein [Cytophagales bacterium]
MKTLSCPFCGASQPISASACSVCQTSLTLDNEELVRTRRELSRLRQDSKTRLDDLEKRILMLEKQALFAQEQKKFIDKPQDSPEPVVAEATIPEPILPQVPVSEPINIPVKVPKIIHDAKKPDVPVYKKPAGETAERARTKKSTTPPPPPFEWRKYIPDVVFELLITPFSHLLKLWLHAYNHYKNTNKLPVFFMTIGGIAAFLMGFGYLMRYTSDTVWEVSKIAISAISAIFVLFLGHRLQKRDTNFQEYGSALLAFGVSLNFLWIYFLDSSPILPKVLSQTSAFLVLVALNNALSAFLAVKYKSRIVLILSMCLGALSPFFAQVLQINLLYFVYLWFLCITCIEIGRRMSWEVSVKLTFWLVLGVNQFIFFNYPSSLTVWAFCGVIQIFTYLFFYYVLHKKHQIKEKLDTEDIFVLAATVSLLAADLYILFADQVRMGGFVFLVNAFIFAVFFILRRSILSIQMQSVVLVVSGAMLAFAIPSLFERDLSGLCWGLEAALLLYLGGLFSLPLVRYQAIIVLVLAFCKTLLLTPLIYTNWGVMLWNDGYLNLLSLGLILGIFVLLFSRTSIEKTAFEEKILFVFREILISWFLICSFIAAHFFLRDWAYPCMTALGLACVLLSRRWKLVFAEAYSFLAALAPIWGLVIIFDSTQDLAFRMLPWYGRADILLLALVFSGTAFYYEKFLADSQKSLVYTVALLMRELVFLVLPFFFLSTFWRFYGLYFPAALWLSLAVLFVLREFVERFWMPYMAVIIMLLGTFVLVLFAAEDLAPSNMQPILLAAATSLIILGAYMAYKKVFLEAHYANNPFKIATSLAFYYLCLLLSLGMWRFVFINDFLSGLTAGTLLLSIFVLFKSQLKPFSFTAPAAYRLVQILLVFVLHVNIFMVSTMLFFQGFIAMGGIALILLYMVYNPDTRYPFANKQFWLGDVYIAHVLLLGFYRVVIINYGELWGETIFTVFCFLHGVALLFNASLVRYQKLMTLAVLFFALAVLKLWFVDMANADMIRKIIVLMAVGLVLLMSAFLYVKMRDKMDQNQDAEQNKA